jgi:hypothetical protein
VRMIVPFTLTPEPTLSSENAQSLTKKLLITNAGCKPPCWWGLTPGKTSLEEIRSFFSTFRGIANDYAIKDDPGLIGWTIPNKDRHLDIYTTFGGKDQLLNCFFIGTQSLKPIPNGYGLVYGDYFYNQSMKRYSLSQILSDYGLPFMR